MAVIRGISMAGTLSLRNRERPSPGTDVAPFLAAGGGARVPRELLDLPLGARRRRGPLVLAKAAPLVLLADGRRVHGALVAACGECVAHQPLLSDDEQSA